VHFENYGKSTHRWYDVYAFLYKKDLVGALFRDITEHRKAEEALRQSEEKLRVFVQASSDVVYRMSADWKEMRQLRGREFIPDTNEPNRTWIEKYIHPDDQQHVWAVIKRAIKTKGIFELEHRVIRVNGSLGWIYSRAIPLLDKEGKITEWFGTASDITERKKTQEELIRSSQRMNEILESISDDFMVLDKNWNYVYANSQAAKLVGLEPKDIVGHNFWNLFPQNKGTHIERNLREAMQKREIRRFEIFGQYSRRYKLITAYPSVDGIALIATDITERKSLEKQLQEKERMAAIGQTAGMVGHDLRNPLQSIIGEVYLAKTELKSIPDSEHKVYLQESIQAIAEQISYMDKIVSDLQTFVKPVEPQMQIVKLKPLIVALLAQTNIPKMIQTNTQIPDALTVEADPQLLKRVLINLITNAIQAMQQGGELTIKAENNKHGQTRITVAVSYTHLTLPTNREV